MPWSEWKKHDGGECPVDAGTQCEVTLNTGATIEDVRSPEFLPWGVITHYREWIEGDGADDLTARLRKQTHLKSGESENERLVRHWIAMDEAADRIEALEAEIAGLRARNAELVEAAENVLASLDNDTLLYERNGPQWTSPQGNEYESTSDVLACSAERAEVLRRALLSKQEETDGA